MSGVLSNEFSGRNDTYSTAGPPGSGTSSTVQTRPYVANQTAQQLSTHKGPQDRSGNNYTPPVVS